MGMPIYQLSKELGIPNNELLVLLEKQGVAVNPPPDWVEESEAKALIEKLAKKGESSQTKKLAETTPESKVGQQGLEGNLREVNQISIKPPIAVRELASLMKLKPFKIIAKLQKLGKFADMNQIIEEELAVQLAEEHGFELEIRHRGTASAKQKPVKEKKSLSQLPLEPKAPVVCVLGHVDHGKTTLLDKIRKANVTASESGGITQHMGAYRIVHDGHPITFLDTPGHAAFSKIRQRGAMVMDVAILVVGADDGFMPQTDEALKFAKKENVPIIVAINKVDVKGADINKVKEQMQQRGITSEDWGGETLCMPISALKEEGLGELLNSILLQTEILELKAPKQGLARGVVIESQVDPEKGSSATIILEEGTLKLRDVIVAGKTYARVRALLDENSNQLVEVFPSMPAKVLGWSHIPEVGTEFEMVKNEKAAKDFVEAFKREHVNRPSFEDAKASITDLDSLMSALDKKNDKVLKIVIKADVQGSLEAGVDLLKSIKTELVKLEVIDASVGVISKKDVDLADSSKAVIVGFGVKFDVGVPAQIKRSGVKVLQSSIIYELVDLVKETMSELLDPEYKEVVVGKVEVRAVFASGKGKVAGCMVVDGVVNRGSYARLFRKGKEILKGKVETLRRFKDDVNEVKSGYECGIALGAWNDYEQGDLIELFQVKESRPSL